MSLLEISNPYCIVGIIIFVIILVINIYYKFFHEKFTIEPVTAQMNKELIDQITNELESIQQNLNQVTDTVYTSYTNNLTQLLSVKNINIVEAYPYLPLYSILQQDNKDTFNEIIELLPEELNLINKHKDHIEELLTDYIYILVLYKNYVPDEYVNSSLNSEFILNKKYKLIYDSEYLQFIKTVDKIKELDIKLYELLIKYIFNFNQIIGDTYYGMKISIVFDIIKSYINEIKMNELTKQDELADIYINLNYIVDYLPSFKKYIDNVIDMKSDMINIFNKTNTTSSLSVSEEPTPGSVETSSGLPVSEETSSGLPVSEETSSGLSVSVETSSGLPVSEETTIS